MEQTHNTLTVYGIQRSISSRKTFTLTLFGLVSIPFFSQILLSFLLWQQPIPHPWIIGEWLINYQGGFVRRGLLGEIIFQIAQRLPIPTVQLAILVQTTILAVFLTLTYYLIRTTELSPITFTLLFSPAFLLFSFYSWPHLGVRKELVLESILLLVILRLRLSKTTLRFLPIWVGGASIVAVLTHEMLVLFLPYIIAATIIYERYFGPLSRSTTIALLPAVLIGSFIVRSPQVSAEVTGAICDSIQPIPTPDCIMFGEVLGAISLLELSTEQGIEFVRRFTTPETSIVYLITGFISFIPIVIAITSYRLWQGIPRRGLVATIIFIGMSLLATIPLMIVAADYGRFINIHVTCLTFLLIWLIQEAPNRISHVHQQHTLLSWIAVIVFVVSWRLPMWLRFASYENAFPLLRWFT